MMNRSITSSISSNKNVSVLKTKGNDGNNTSSPTTILVGSFELRSKNSKNNLMVNIDGTSTTTAKTTTPILKPSSLKKIKNTKTMMTSFKSSSKINSTSNTPPKKDDVTDTTITPKRRVHFDTSVDWSKESEKTQRGQEKRLHQKEIRRQHNQTLRERNETYLVLCLGDIDVLIKQYSLNPTLTAMFDMIFNQQRITSSTDQTVAKRLFKFRANPRECPKYLLSMERKFDMWRPNGKRALDLIHKHSPLFSEKSKEYNQRLVLFHLKYTMKKSDLGRISHDYQEQRLVKKCLKWFFREVYKSLTDAKNNKIKTNKSQQQQQLRRTLLPLPFQNEIQYGFDLLRNEQIEFESLTDVAKSILFVISQMKGFLMMLGTNTTRSSKK